MRTLVLLLLCLLALGARAERPTEATVDQLLEASQSPALTQAMLAQMEQSARAAAAASAKGRKLTDEQRKSLDRIITGITATLRQELAWEKVRPIFLQVYQETLEQEEVEALIAFYRSPTGQMMLRKMPLIMQRTGVLMQMRMQQVLPRLHEQMNKEMKAAGLPTK